MVLPFLFVHLSLSVQLFPSCYVQMPDCLTAKIQSLALYLSFCLYLCVYASLPACLTLSVCLIPYVSAL